MCVLWKIDRCIIYARKLFIIVFTSAHCCITLWLFARFVIKNTFPNFHNLFFLNWNIMPVKFTINGKDILNQWIWLFRVKIKNIQSSLFPHCEQIVYMEN